MPECVSNADSHEHTVGEVPHLISSRAVGGPPNGRWHHVLEEEASRRREMLGSVLSVWTHAGLRLDVVDFHACQDLVVKMSDASHDQHFDVDQCDDVEITR